MGRGQTLFRVSYDSLVINKGELISRKANLIDQRFAPSWIAFSHSLAFEGEHDAAITAFSTCATLFRG